MAPPPFLLKHQLSPDLDHQPSTLPGHPCVSLQDRQLLWDFVETDLWAQHLERIAHRLWWMSKQDSANISPLHRQAVKQRRVIVTEDPKLHLVWFHDRIFIKPLPRYLGSHVFWRDFLCGGDQDAPGGRRRARIAGAALGYLRTYRHLVKHESDFRIAQDPGLCLIPAHVSWEHFSMFASDLAAIADTDVSRRYHFGEIRLSRLNLYAPLLLGTSHFQRVDSQYGAYFARLYAPVLFVIGVTSVILSALQVTVAVEQDQVGMGRVVSRVALALSVLVMLVSSCLLLGLGCLLVYKVAREWNYALGDRRRWAKLNADSLTPVV